MIFSFELSGTQGTAVLLERPSLPAPGDIEYSFLSEAAGALRPHRRETFGRLLGQVAARSDTNRIVAVRNPRLVLDAGFGARLRAALTRLDSLSRPFSIAAAGGMTATGECASALYSAVTPFLPVEPSPQPLTDPMPDLWVADAEFVHSLTQAVGPLPDSSVETIIALRGWLDGRIALSLPELKGGINGPFLTNEGDQASAALLQGLGPDYAGETIDTLIGPISLHEGEKARKVGTRSTLAAAVEEGVAAASDPLSLSIVTRTRFDRPHLLDRLLTSISRARREDMDLEVVISTDVDTDLAEQELAALRQRFVNLELRLARGRTGAPSRVANLLAGLYAAAKEYVAILDDDDYLDLFAFDNVGRALFLGERPIIVAGSEVHEETWERAPNGRYVLSTSVPRAGWSASGWRRIFGGTNTLPICAVIMPRGRLLKRLDTFTFRHDLSEDYALLLLLLSDPALPAIAEVPGSFAHISLRDGNDNSVTVADRRGWVRDIALYLDDLTTDPNVASAGLWRLLSLAAEPRHVIDAEALEAARAELARRERQVRLLEHQVSRLRSAAARQEIPA